MQITVTYASRQINQCGGDPKYNASGCGGVIEYKERIFKGAWWHQKRYMTKYWHFDCYVQGSKLYLDVHPFIPKPGGIEGGRPKKLYLTEEQRKQRAYLGVKAHMLRKRMKEVVDLGLSTWINEKTLLDRKYQELVPQYEECGGLPHGWMR